MAVPIEPTGIALGVLIGIVSGFTLLLLLWTIFSSRQKPGLRKTTLVVGQLLAIPTFWFSGPWVTTKLVASVDLTRVFPSYVVTLAITFVIVVGPVLRNFSRRIAAQAAVLAIMLQYIRQLRRDRGR